MLYYGYGYQVHQAERVMNRAEQRDADAQLGQLSAAVGRWARSLGRPVRAMRREPEILILGACPPSRGQPAGW
jgi:hypothetical protein